MSKIISVHSFRGGTGKSNTTANISTLLAMEGFRVGVVDTDIASPGIHVLFNLDETEMAHSLNDYLWGKCTIEEAAHDVTGLVGGEVKGKIFLIPSSIKAGEIARILREGYDVGLLNDGFKDVVDKLNLDYLLIDTHPGLNEETLLSIAISDALVIILRPDSQDYQGTAVTVDVARKLDVPKMLMLVNKVPTTFDLNEVRKRVEETYNATVAAVFPHSDEMMTLASSGIFSIQYPDSAVTKAMRELVNQIK
ncbi:MAG: MinD/ParA family protein [Anaerolineales bacterium]|nr:MinD/ParA family protein [Anaerolineales bacterium]MBP6210326.1 MinD/ParA family protein [Anaerolineales bacterium]MBP8165030.1 MinD/ParA family protein [Anaerolineales bacterium]